MHHSRDGMHHLSTKTLRVSAENEPKPRFGRLGHTESPAVDDKSEVSGGQFVELLIGRRRVAHVPRAVCSTHDRRLHPALDAAEFHHDKRLSLIHI